MYHLKGYLAFRFKKRSFNNIMPICPGSVDPFTSKLLAHLSRRLIGELIGYTWSGVRPSVVRPSVVRSQCSNIFFSKTAWPIKAKIYVEPPWVGGTKVCSRHLGHMTKMAGHANIWYKPFKNLLLQNRRADFHETLYVASGTPAHHSLFK